jgi:hypothetical protein
MADRFPGRPATLLLAFLAIRDPTSGQLEKPETRTGRACIHP